MAEAIAAVSLVAAVVSLVDFGTKLLLRINEFKDDYDEKPKTFENIRTRLPLTLDSLQRIKGHAEKGKLSDRTVKAVSAVIDECLVHVKLLNDLFENVLPSKGASGLERRWLALKSLSKDKVAQNSVRILEAQIQNLILYQTTNSTDHILELLELQNLKIQDSQDSSKNFDHGLCLGNAPQLYDGAFKGRQAEMELLYELLAPKIHHQGLVALTGLGGVGKTQLSIEFARRYQSKFSAVFWFNSKTEISLKEDLVTLSGRIISHSPRSTSANEVDEVIARLRQWFSQGDNWRWLIIFDNYDNPNLPGLRNEDGFDIRKFFPFTSQGSILITSRTRKLEFAKQIDLKKLSDPADRLAILKERSGREVDGDQEALRLVERLDGLPLALVTAATYVRQGSDTFGDYLKAYEESLQDLNEFSDEMLDYEDRTLYSTWNLSFKKIENDETTAKFFRLLAYFDNRDIWFELFQIDSGPSWFRELASDKNKFRKCMSRLQDFSLIDAHAGSYAMHACVHDWALMLLNREFSTPMFTLAAMCIASHVRTSGDKDKWAMNRRLYPHAEHINNKRFRALADHIPMVVSFGFAVLYQDQGKLKEAEQMYKKASEAADGVLGSKPGLIMNMLVGLGSLYYEQTKLQAAEKSFLEALSVYVKARQPRNTALIEILHGLAKVYHKLDRYQEAERTFQRALEASEWLLEPEDESRLDISHSLGTLYIDQNRMHDAETMLKKVLIGKEKLFGVGRPATLSIISDIGDLYLPLGRLAEAERMYLTVLTGMEETAGADHPLTFATIRDIGTLKIHQKEFEAAEIMYSKALIGFNKFFGPAHKQTLESLLGLGTVYVFQGKLDEAEKLFSIALMGLEDVLGPHHTSTMSAVLNLGVVYREQGRTTEAADYIKRCAEGFERALGAEHPKTKAATAELQSLG